MAMYVHTVYSWVLNFLQFTFWFQSRKTDSLRSYILCDGTSILSFRTSLGQFWHASEITSDTIVWIECVSSLLCSMYKSKQQTSIIVKQIWWALNIALLMQGNMDEQFSLPNKVHREHTIDVDIFAYSHGQTKCTFFGLLLPRLFFRKWPRCSEWFILSYMAYMLWVLNRRKGGGGVYTYE